MPKDKRCRYKYRECNPFYLYIKYKKSHIYYCIIPEFNKVVSTGKTNRNEAYIRANEIYNNLLNNKTLIWEGITDKLILSMLPKHPEQLTLARAVQIQQAILATGVTGKTVNNRMCQLSKYIKVPPLAHKKKVRGSYPIEKLYHIGKINLLAFIAITTGMRKGEFSKCHEFTDDKGRLMLFINGTKTENCVRSIPIIPEIADAINEYKLQDWSDRDFRFAVDEVGRLIGEDPEKNNITFHSYRYNFKTAMMSVGGIDQLWQEYFLGHSLDKSNVSRVSQVYFDPKSADVSVVYEQITEMQRKFL